MGGGQPLSDGLHHIDGDAVSGLLVKLGVGLERQDKVERAAQLARFIHLGKTLLLSEGGPRNV